MKGMLASLARDELGIFPEVGISREKTITYKHRKLMIELKLSFDKCLPCIYICNEVVKCEQCFLLAL